LILVRELDERLGLGEPIAERLSDSRPGKNTQLPLADLFRQSVYSRVAGYEDVNDAERLAQDPAFRLIGSQKVRERGAALTSRLQAFETEMPAEQDRQLVVDEFPAASGKDWRPADRAREALLAAAGGKRPDAAAVRGDGTPDCRLTGGGGGEGEIFHNEQRGTGRCRWNLLEK
jgi:hypothetical protein